MLSPSTAFAVTEGTPCAALYVVRLGFPLVAFFALPKEVGAAIDVLMRQALAASASGNGLHLRQPESHGMPSP